MSDMSESTATELPPSACHVDGCSNEAYYVHWVMPTYGVRETVTVCDDHNREADE